MKARRTPLLTAAVVALLGATIPGTALADATYPAAHIDLHAVDSAPLRTGFVQNIHTQGPNVYAHEIYVLNGAVPDATFDVSLTVYPLDITCSTAEPLSLGVTATFTTNRAGNGHADHVFTPADAAGFQGTHGAIWEFTDGSATYRSDCETVILD